MFQNETSKFEEKKDILFMANLIAQRLRRVCPVTRVELLNLAIFFSFLITEFRAFWNTSSQFVFKLLREENSRG